MSILNKLEKLKYERDRAKYLRQVISNIGTIKESEDSIICYVEQELLEKNSRKAFYELHCNGMNTKYDKSRELVDYFKLNKPVYYIFDRIHFDTVVNIASKFSNIIFKNCTFNTGIRIFFADSITLENNKYNYLTNFMDYENAFLWGTVGNLEIKNEKFINQYAFKKYGENNFGINIVANHLKIENSTVFADILGQINIEADHLKIDTSTVYAKNLGQIFIKAKETNILNSILKAPEVYLDSDSLTFKISLLNAKNGVIIENKNCDFVGVDAISSPYTIYNGTEIITDYEVEEKEVKEKRLALVNVLTNVINKCNQNTLVKSASVKKDS